ncbi:MAG: glycosyltransferase family 9 protein [Acidobacteriota bacterium]
MNQVLIIKCGAAGDVVRTTTLLHPFSGWEIDWLVSKENRMLLPESRLRSIYEEPEALGARRYDLVISLEDDADYLVRAMAHIRYDAIFGAYPDQDGRLHYTDSASGWFDMGLISRYGIQEANRLKYANHRSYQEIIFEGLGLTFQGEPYVMPDEIPPSALEGDIAVALTAGKRWPMKNWYAMQALVDELSGSYKVNVLPVRPTLIEHLADIRNHRFVIAPDSLPMHLALGLSKPCLAIFPCTSPWEIFDYGLLTKIVSPKLERYFFGKGFEEEAVTCIGFEQVMDTTLSLLERHGIAAREALEVRAQR